MTAWKASKNLSFEDAKAQLSWNYRSYERHPWHFMYQTYADYNTQEAAENCQHKKGLLFSEPCLDCCDAYEEWKALEGLVKDFQASNVKDVPHYICHIGIGFCRMTLPNIVNRSQ